MKPIKYKRFEYNFDFDDQFQININNELKTILELGYLIHTYQEFEMKNYRIKIVILCVKYSEPLIF